MGYVAFMTVDRSRRLIFLDIFTLARDRGAMSAVSGIYAGRSTWLTNGIAALHLDITILPPQSGLYPKLRKTTGRFRYKERTGRSCH
jgi:hypothetical protein